jgi:excisionase family DNA binding protein
VIVTKPKAKSWRVDGLPVVYFLQADGANELIKIGKSIDFASRFSGLCSDNACALKILGVIERPTPTAALTLERELHDRFLPHHHHGEWYHPREPLLQYIAVSVISVERFNEKLTAKITADEKTLDDWLANDAPEALLTIDEVAELLGVQPITVRRQVERKLLPCIRVGQKLLRFDRRDVLRSPFALALRQQKQVA